MKRNTAILPSNVCLSDLPLIQKNKMPFVKRFYLFIFIERGKEGEREEEKHQCVVVSCAPPTGNLACNPDKCPDWESNQQSFHLQAGTLSSDPHFFNTQTI